MIEASLVITTYNWKQTLSRVLDSVKSQSVLPIEVIIADDGSNDGTDELIEALRPTFPVPIIHIWQEDRGFRAAMSRNKAIAASHADYIILIDGDMVLNPRFVEDHLAHASEGCFIQGGRVLLGAQLSECISNNSLALDDIRWWMADLSNRKNCFRIPLLARWAAWLSNNHIKGIRSCNQSFWKADLLRVNGFNEAFEGWGREDSELVVRLYKSGLKRKNLKFLAIAYHLYHQQFDRQRLSKNDALLQRAQASAHITCARGIQQYLNIPLDRTHRIGLKQRVATTAHRAPITPAVSNNTHSR